MSQNFRPIGHEDHHILRNEKDEHGIWRQVCSCGKRLTLADYPAMIYTKCDNSLKTLAVSDLSVDFDPETVEKSKKFIEKMDELKQELDNEIFRRLRLPIFEEPSLQEIAFKPSYGYSPLPRDYLMINLDEV